MIAWEAARGRGPDSVAELEVARTKATPAARQALAEAAHDCLAALAELERVVDERLGAIGQSLGRSEAAVQGAFGRLRNLKALTAQVEALGRRGG